MKIDPRIESYIANAADFAQPILHTLRERVHKSCPDVVETMKWSFPHFMYRDEILCSMAGFKAHCAFGFWKAALLKIDSAAETAMGDFGRITSVNDLPSAATFAKYVKHAMKLTDEGAKLPSLSKSKSVKAELVTQPALAMALKKNKTAEKIFAAFVYSKKKDYITWIDEAKTDATRERRVAQAVEWIAEGKGRNWKYEKC